jgi:exodeoxyribonuclease V beta subunit
LGDTLEDYAPDKLNEAMNENNYHLQYMIYTYAADRFLKARMAEYDYEKHFGGVIYLFIRGVRKDKDTGIFAHRPTREDMEKLDGIFKLY